MGDWGEVIGGPRTWARDLGLALFVALTLAFIGPFGSYELPLEQRLLACVAYGLAGSVVFWPALRGALLLGARAGLPDIFATAVALAVASLPVSLVVWLIHPLVAPIRHSPPPVELYFAVLALAVPIGFAVLFVGRWAAPRAEPAPTAANEAGAVPRLLDRVPPKTRGDLLALQAEDHYVRVHTTGGDALILMRLADAIAEAGEGLRVHRSWWVAKGAVADAKTEGRRATLTLTNGLAVPVTRETVPEIRRAGWL